MDPLDRFRDAQGGEEAGWAAAVAELRRGRKRGHWIWYVFPQLAGLGHSAMSRHFGVAGREEAAAYLADDQLRTRLEEATAVVAEQLAVPGQSIDVLMGSAVDAAKLVSSLTLFEAVGAALGREGDSRPSRLVSLAGVVLASATEQGYPRCAFTAQVLAGSEGGRG